MTQLNLSLMRTLSTVTGFVCLCAVASSALAADLQPYDKIVTKEAKTSHGIFTVHQIADQYYYEIPKDQFDKEFLWNARVSQTTQGVGFGGFLVADHVVRWQLSGPRVLLRDVNYEATADPRTPLAAAVKASNNDTIVMAFDVLALSPEGAPVIDVTRLFISDLAEFGLRTRLGATALDGARTWIDRVSAHPQNIEVEATQTWFRNDASVVAGLMHPGDATIVVHHSMVRLPAQPMMPRLYDERVGYFQNLNYDYTADEQRASQRSVIDRWRLEKKDPAAAVSEPVKPIVLYIDPATPAKWRDSIRKGVEEWLPALEAAGFRNAIQVRPAPEPSEDPDFSVDDVRYSVIRWLPTTTQDAFGPNVHDPRTGEILNADIEFNQNMLSVARNWYFVQAADLDPGASTIPLSDAAMGRAIQMVIAHEVGHTLGLEHNMKASSLYPAEKVHDKSWVATMGFTPSVMDYVRFNYVAQPEDGFAPEDLVARVGPYDRWAIHWGYAPIPDATTPDDEKPTLDQWAREQDTTPWFRYTTLVGWGWGADASELKEAVGDADAIASTGLGLKNLKRIEKMLVPGATAKAGAPMDELVTLHNALIGQWTAELGHVIAIVGGSTSQAKAAGQSGVVFTPIPAERQKAAVKFLLENAFATPTWLIDPEVLRRIEPAGELARLRDTQSGMLTSLLDSVRFQRIVEQDLWSPAEFLSAIRTGIWSELRAPRVKIDAYRRNLQRAWLDLAIGRSNGANSDERALYRAELKALEGAIVRVLPGVADAVTKAHLEAARAQMVKALDTRTFSPAPVAVANRAGAAAVGETSCFPDYSTGAGEPR